MIDSARPQIRLAWAAALLLASACASPKAAPPIQYPDYHIGAPDVLTLTILPEPRVEQRVVVRPDGKITVELVGDVQAGGRTAREVAADIEQRIGRFKRGAVVTVALEQAASPTITVIGEVARPGSFPLDRQMRISEVIGLVGDTTLYSSPGKVRVIRAGKVHQVDLWEIRAGDLSRDIQVYAGDVVYVPSSILARIGYGFQILLFPFQPLLGVATAAGGDALVN